ncbi:Werner Syndrome-like exonuclease [Vitis riparia]|uniref:Werner Syndrome-like exonuclease n=1 Tax=Vitis riparia TaxID=96939 RepID=UPI00155A964B|nr:Werner Syndrome-like exonuclease [Vitis riparia]
METRDHPSSSSPSPSPSPSIFSVPEWDWDQPMTQQQLEELDAIESAFRSQTSSSTPTSQEADDRRKIRRRLPNSIGSNRCPSAFKGRDLNSFSLSPCPTNRFLNLLHSPCQENFKMRLPKMNFGGHIVYSRTVTEVEKATAELLKIVETKKKEMGQAILGFDIEWRPTFRKGVSQGKAAVMQICGGNSHCYVMHIIHSGIPQNLQSLLEDPTSIKVGVGIANDAVKVFKDHSVSVKDLEDLSYLANQKLGGDAKKWGLGSLTEMLISKQVNSMYLFGESFLCHLNSLCSSLRIFFSAIFEQLLKPNKIRLGNWEADVLSKAQLEYAATDAFASWYLYEVLKSFPDTAENKIEELEGKGLNPTIVITP